MPLPPPVLLGGALVGLLLAGPAARAQEAACVGGVAAGYPCDRVDLAARLPLSAFATAGVPAPTRASEVWGWTDPETDREYALFGVTTGVAFVDVTEPAAPIFLGLLPSAFEDDYLGRWRLVRVYGDHAFVGSETADHGVQVFSLARLRDVASPPETFEADARYTGAGSAHTLVADEATGFLYLAGADQSGYACNGGGLHIVDVRDPLDPTFAGCFDEDGYVHEAQCLVYDGPDADYAGRELCVAYNVDHVAFVDVTDKAAPALISTVTYPTPGYTHQGWFTRDKRHLLVNDELDEINGYVATARTIILDVEDLDAPSFFTQYLSDLTVVDHNLYVVGDYVFQSNDEAGLRILDARDVADGTLREVAYFDTYPQSDSPNFNGQWMNYPFFSSGTVVASDRSGGLFVLRPQRDPVAGEPAPTPAAFSLSEALPNPFSDRAALTLSVAEPQRVRAQAFDALGRHVATLFDGPVAAGQTERLAFEGASLPPGLYVVRVTGGTFAAARRVSLVR